MTFSSGNISTSYSDYVIIDTAYSWSGGASNMVSYSNSSSSSQTVNVKSRGTDYSNNSRSTVLTRTASFTATLKSGYTNAAQATSSAKTEVTITQDKNIITGVSVTTNAGAITHSAGTVAASGEEVSVTSSTAGSHSGVLTFSSTSTTTTSDTYGSWSYGYTWSESDSNNMVSFTNSDENTSSARKVTVASRGSDFNTSTRSATVTRKYTATFTLNSTYDDGATSGTNNASTKALTIT
jgi:hypothetical protein